MFEAHQPTGEVSMGEIIDKTKGKIKQLAGVLAGDKRLIDEGRMDEVKGKVKAAMEDLKHSLKNAAKK
jgi:uncharacterized protein YjbJ (UPF0337 family)